MPSIEKEVKCRTCGGLCESHKTERPVRMHSEGLMHLSSIVTHEHTGMYFCINEDCTLYKVLRAP
jgi:hypothetical protein